MKVCFETFGCRLNKAEALQMEAEYAAKGWKVVTDYGQADLFVVRGCSVTAHAQHECEQLVERLRAQYPNVPLRVCGCLSSENSSGISATLAKLTTFEDTCAIVPTRTARAYLKVQDGCSGKCTFCIVPKFRGKSVSVSFTKLMNKAIRFILSGYREIVVTGCNLSLYSSEGRRLPDLLDALASLTPPPPDPQSCRIRLGSLEPGPQALSTVETIARNPNICKFLHLTVQSASDMILKQMKRPYSAREVDALISQAVRLMPNLGLGCDLMAGFPGESQLDFMLTRGFLQCHPFTNAHVFPFSERPGTPADDLPFEIPPEIRDERARDLADLANYKRSRFAKTFVGKTVEMIVEGKDRCTGWTGEYLPCEAMGSAPRKSLVRVLVTKTKEDRLEGRIVD